MITDIYDYFQKLEDKKFPRLKKSILYDESRMHYDPNAAEDKRELSIDGTNYFYKQFHHENTLVEIASTNMYNEIGIPTPPVSLIREFLPDGPLSPEAYVVNPDINQIPEYEFILGIPLFKNNGIRGFFPHDRWGSLYDSDIRRKFLKFLTPECFDQLIGLSLVDEIRSERDRHLGNIFFYRKKGNTKYEGCIPIDNELIQLMHQYDFTKSDFQTFLLTKYSAGTPLCDMDSGTYISRIGNIRELLQDGMLTQGQIDLMKRAINYNFPKTIKQIGSNPLFAKKRKPVYDSVSRLWEYHHNNLGKDLEL